MGKEKRSEVRPRKIRANTFHKSAKPQHKSPGPAQLNTTGTERIRTDPRSPGRQETKLETPFANHQRQIRSVTSSTRSYQVVNLGRQGPQSKANIPNRNTTGYHIRRNSLVLAKRSRKRP